MLKPNSEKIDKPKQETGIEEAHAKVIKELQAERDALKVENKAQSKRIEELSNGLQVLAHSNCDRESEVRRLKSIITDLKLGLERRLPMPTSMPALPEYDPKWTDQMKAEWMKAFRLLVDVNVDLVEVE